MQTNVTELKKEEIWGKSNKEQETRQIKTSEASNVA